MCGRPRDAAVGSGASNASTWLPMKSFRASQVTPADSSGGPSARPRGTSSHCAASGCRGMGLRRLAPALPLGRRKCELLLPAPDRHDRGVAADHGRPGDWGQGLRIHDGAPRERPAAPPSERGPAVRPGAPRRRRRTAGLPTTLPAAAHGRLSPTRALRHVSRVGERPGRPGPAALRGKNGLPRTRARSPTRMNDPSLVRGVPPRSRS